MKKYDSYIDSGIQWIGEIPSQWKTKRLKFFAKICNGQDHKAVNEEAGMYPIYGSGGQFGAANEYLYDKPSVLLGRKGTIDKPRYVEHPFWTVDTAYYTKVLQCNDTKFFYYLCTTINFELYKYGSAIPSMTQGTLNDIVFCSPSFEEQIAIANYLDQKTAQIDDLIAKKERLIQLLEEERTAIINQAVTKGLDLTVPMKDSGIEWLGEIPAHWEVKSFRFCIDILTDYTANGSFASLAENVTYYDSGYSRLVRLTDLRVDLLNEGLYVDEHAHNFLKKSELFGGEILIANVGAYAGLVMQMPIMEGKFTLGPNMFLVRLNQNTEFFLTQLNAPFCAEQLKMMSVSSAQPKLNKENIRQLKVITPPIEEQNLIANHILKEKSRIETITAKTQQEIELLKEYKTALISEVVTGKVDVSTSSTQVLGMKN